MMVNRAMSDGENMGVTPLCFSVLKRLVFAPRELPCLLCSRFQIRSDSGEFAVNPRDAVAHLGKGGDQPDDENDWQCIHGDDDEHPNNADSIHGFSLMVVLLSGKHEYAPYCLDSLALPYGPRKDFDCVSVSVLSTMDSVNTKERDGA